VWLRRRAVAAAALRSDPLGELLDTAQGLEQSRAAGRGRSGDDGKGLEDAVGEAGVAECLANIREALGTLRAEELQLKVPGVSVLDELGA
jgi:hypothetical protein